MQQDIKFVFEGIVAFILAVLTVYILVRVAGTAWFRSKTDQYRTIKQEKMPHE